MATTAKKHGKLAKARNAREGSVAAIIRGLIAKGRTNDDIFAQLKKRRMLDESKRHWPQWYRRQMKISGDIDKRFADQHAH